MEQYEKYLINAITATSAKIDKYEDDDIALHHMYKEIYDRFVEAFIKYQVYVKGFDVEIDGIDSETLKTELEEEVNLKDVV